MQGQLVLLLGQILALVRHDGQINIRLRQVFFIEVLKPVCRVAEGLRIQRIFLLHRKSVCQIDAVVVALVQNAIVEQGFDCPEGIPQRELIQGNCFKIRHEPAIQQSIHANPRPLGQGSF